MTTPAVPASGTPDGDEQELRQLATRGTALGERIQGLESAVAAARGRLDEALLDEVASITARAAGRVRLSATHTVVAIAGATGSGKSSTFNALTGLELSSTGVRRPTTSWATACVWGTEGAAEVLEWLGIPPRHQTMRESMLDTRHEDSALDGVVLMDLPDHDSTEVSHHLEVDRLVELADLLVWVLDPQKYADAAIHDRYFRPFATHEDVMLVVLNHIDTVPKNRREAMVEDVRRLLADDGLPDVKVIPVSARVGIGMDELRAEIASRVAAKRSTTARVEADLTGAAQRLEEAAGAGRSRELSAQEVRRLEDAVVAASGVPSTVAGVERSLRERAARATTWPPLALLGRSGGGAHRSGLGEEVGAGMARLRGATGASRVPRAVLDVEVLALADAAADGIGPQWAESVRRAATARTPDAADRLDTGLAQVDLGVDRLPSWVALLRVVQWLLLATALTGLGWWGYLAVRGTADDAPKVAGLPLPAFVLIGGLVLGLVLAGVARGLVAGLARRRAAAADERLRGVVSSVLDEEIVGPVSGALATYTTFRTGIASALR